MTHEPENEAAQTTETRLGEEDKKTDESTIVLDAPTEPPDKDRREPEVPATTGLTEGTTLA